ncbi:hypothetical protein [Pseudomonas viridiflava]|uniref:hypothetical protein n=1 Tax=Pseudomonas viridiflava TaxID=33069 RepID=UPI000F0654F4|nr:hypothetical protein [Pseudomonas viridiflava]
MTTVVWNTEVLAADTLHRAGNHYGENANKIFIPEKTVLFEGAALVAAAGAGAVYLLKDWWKFMCASACSVQALEQKMQSTLAHVTVPMDRQGFLILTVNRCFKVEISEKKASHSDVTGVPTAIGTGARVALPLIEEFGVFTAIARAARLDEANTNSQVTWINRQLGSTLKSATGEEMARARLEDRLLQFRIPKCLWRRQQCL